MAERISILQTKLLSRVFDLPPDTLLYQLRQKMATIPSSQWNSLQQSHLWQNLPLPRQDVDLRTLKAEITRFRNNNFKNMLQQPNHQRLAACRPYISIDPILWLPMTTKERSRVVRWRIGFLPGKPVSCWCQQEGAFTTINHLMACFHVHSLLNVPHTITIDPISHLLNKLPKKPPKQQHQKEYWIQTWPLICSLLYKIDYCCHPNEDFSSSEDPNPGQCLLQWINSTKEQNPFQNQHQQQQHPDFNNIFVTNTPPHHEAN